MLRTRATLRSQLSSRPASAPTTTPPVSTRTTSGGQTTSRTTSRACRARLARRRRRAPTTDRARNQKSARESSDKCAKQFLTRWFADVVVWSRRPVFPSASDSCAPPPLYDRCYSVMIPSDSTSFALLVLFALCTITAPHCVFFVVSATHFVSCAYTHP